MTHLFLTVLNYGCVTKCSDLRHARSFFFLFESRHVHGYMQAIASSSCCSLQVFTRTRDRKYVERTCRETERKRLTETEKRERKKDKQYTNERNNDARSRCRCRAKARSITYSECVSVAFVI